MSPEDLERIRTLHSLSSFSQNCVSCTDDCWPCSTAELLYLPDEIERVIDERSSLTQRALDRATELRGRNGDSWQYLKSQHPSRLGEAARMLQRTAGLPDNVVPLLRKRTV